MAANGSLGGFTFYEDSSVNRLSNEQQVSFNRIYQNVFHMPNYTYDYTIANMISDITSLPGAGWFLNNKELDGPYLHVSIIEKRPSITSGDEKVYFRVYDIEYTELDGERAHMQFQLTYKSGSLQDTATLAGVNGTAIVTYQYVDTSYKQYIIAHIGSDNQNDVKVSETVKLKRIDLTHP